MIDNPYFNGKKLREYLSLDHNDIQEYHRDRICYLLDEFPFVDKSLFYNKEDHRKLNIFYKRKTNKREYSTSGTTGQPLSFRLNSEFFIYRNSYIIRKILHHYNISIDDCIFIKISPYRQMQYDIVEGSLGFINNYISVRDNMVDEISKEFINKNKIIISSPSIYQKIIDKNINLGNNIKLCISSLERLYDKNKYEDYYNSRFVDWITCLDGGLSAWKCINDEYHIDFEFCKVINNNDNKLYLTDLWNEKELFYNYFNGDYGIVSHKNCGCGNNGFLLKKFLGRETEIIEVNGIKRYGMEIYSTLFPDLNFNECILTNGSDGIVFRYNGGDKNDLIKVEERMNYLFHGLFSVKKEDRDFFLKYQGKKKKIYHET